MHALVCVCILWRIRPSVMNIVSLSTCTTLVTSLSWVTLMEGTTELLGGLRDSVLNWTLPSGLGTKGRWEGDKREGRKGGGEFKN